MIELNKDNIIIKCEPIDFPIVGELNLMGDKTVDSDFKCDNIVDAIRYAIEELKGKKEGNKMKLLNMYVGKSEENIVNYYDNLRKEEEKNDIVKQEYEALVSKFTENMLELAEKYNENNTPNGSYLVEDGAIDCGYLLIHKYNEKEEMYSKLQRDELQQLHDKIDEINAQIECVEMFGDENNANYDMVQSILIEYGVINENGRLTPYTPTYVEETPKKSKKVSE